MRRIAKLAAVVVTAAAFSAPAMAQAKTSWVFNSYSQDFSYSGTSWAGVKACDGDTDGNSVMGHFTRDNTSSYTVHEQRGNGYCSSSGSDTKNRVAKHRSQQIRDWATDPYGPWQYRV
ncbi:hypothetical protein [Streptomyces sp. NPDC052042]|uniref:hypothetical protein n=1 Tax=Streptomyces sp. NPDC052042 TaxID=3365683 RepID=UPI0037D7DB1E